MFKKRPKFQSEIGLKKVKLKEVSLEKYQQSLRSEISESKINT
ncbi:unnamed protein product [Paramecium sonneborni]|uniref:Uncharacterized protein n=1 Tax=Paramecium sonneborni TaxID=65129 RepID=A0A8S1P7T5_9CILI|nr:unnamed protein product [Paramecium sonneborni]